MNSLISKLLLLIVFVPVIAFAKTYKIEMLNNHKGQMMVFEPGFLKIELGDTVVFMPKSLGHNSQSVFSPDKKVTWKGKTSEEVTVTFTKEGVYLYECTNHALLGMGGVIQVGKAANLEAAKKFFEGYKKKFVSNKDRMEGYLKQAK